MSCFVAVAAYCVLWVLSPIIAAFYGQVELEVLLRVLSLVIIFNAANSVQRSWLQRNMDFKALFRANLVGMTTSGLLGIVAACCGLGVWALVVQTLSQGVLTCLAFLVVVPWKPRLYFDARVARELFSYGWKICITGILNVLYTGLSELVIGRACSAVDLGLYSQGRKWPNAAVGVLTNALQNVFFPAFSMLKESREGFMSAVRRCLVSGSYIIVPVSLFFAVAAEPTIVLLLGNQWAACAPVFSTICVSSSLTVMQVVNLRAYMALGDSGLYMRLQIVKVLFGGVCICASAVIAQDIYVVAIVTAIVGVLNVVAVDLQPAKKTLGYSRGRQLRDVAPSFVLSAVATLAAYSMSLLQMSALPMLLLEAAAFAAVYLVGSALFKVEGFSDCIDVARGLLGKARRSR